MQPLRPHAHPHLPLTFAVAVSLALAAAAQNPSAPTIQVYSRETIVDVTVTDAKGNPVHGLTKDDFTVKEDGKDWPIKSFEEFGTQAVQPLPKLPPNVYSNVQPSAASGATNILWLDFTNAAPVFAIGSDPGPSSLARSMERQHHVKQYAMQYLQSMPVGTRVAVIGTSNPGNLRVLQGITSDPAQLSAAVAAMKYDTDANVMILPGDPNDPLGHTIESFCSQQAVRNRMTLEALDQIAAEAARIKGRKNLLWYTTGIPSLTDPAFSQALLAPRYCLPNSSADLQKAYGLLAAAQVTVSPIWVRGVPVAADPLFESHTYEQLSMEAVAEATGGNAYYNSNDLADLTAKAINSGSDYYTLSYVPPGSEYDGRHHSIKIVTSQPGLKLTYRDEYYAEDPRKIAPTPGLTLDATQILFRVQVTQSPASATLSAQNNPDPKHMHPPYRHLSIAYTIDVHGIDFTQTADSNYRGAFEYGVNVYNADGDVINSTVNTVSPIVPPAVYHSMLRTGANAHRDIDIPATGDYFLRIAVHDLTSGRLGAIEIPTSSITPARSEKP
ncbi:MAG: VWA domain-containing protein [Acidobacteriaceae bacterium]